MLNTVKENKKLYKHILSAGLYPKDLEDIMNIVITLTKHFEVELNKRTFNDVLEVSYGLVDTIEDYMKPITNYRVKHNPRAFKKYWLTKEQAFKEQKARGFIHINNFEDYDHQAVHLVSNANTDYYYPLNILTSTQQREGAYSRYINPYIVCRLIAVEGWTRILLPKEYRG